MGGARAVGATVLPAGTGQTELQVIAARDVGSTAYAGTPDYLATILEAADAEGADLQITKAAVSGASAMATPSTIARSPSSTQGRKFMPGLPMK